jgi:acyl carrier protein phosphodiesterase
MMETKVKTLKSITVPITKDYFPNLGNYIALKELCKWFEMVPVTVKTNALDLNSDFISVKIPVLLYNDWFEKYANMRFVKNISIHLNKKLFGNIELNNIFTSYITIDEDTDELYLVMFLEEKQN